VNSSIRLGIRSTSVREGTSRREKIIFCVNTMLVARILTA